MPAAPNTYELARQRANEQANQQAQSQSDAIRRRFASLGNLNSGAAIKQQQIAQDEANQARDKKIAEINAQEADMQGQRDFQREMQDRGFAFQGSQSALERAQQEKLQKMGFDFTGGQNALQRELQRQLQQEGFTFQGGESEKQRQFQAGQSAMERAQQAAQFEKQFGLQQQTFDKEYGQGGLKQQQLDMQKSQFMQQMEIAKDQLKMAKDEAELNKMIANINGMIQAAGIDDDDRRAIIERMIREAFPGQSPAALDTSAPMPAGAYSQPSYVNGIKVPSRY